MGRRRLIIVIASIQPYNTICLFLFCVGYRKVSYYAYLNIVISGPSVSRGKVFLKRSVLKISTAFILALQIYMPNYLFCRSSDAFSLRLPKCSHFSTFYVEQQIFKTMHCNRGAPMPETMNVGFT